MVSYFMIVYINELQTWMVGKLAYQVGKHYIKYAHGMTEALSVNIIANNLLDPVSFNVKQQMIVENKSSTMLYHNLCLFQTYITRQVIVLIYLRGSHVFVSAYIQNEQAFAWWVSYMINKQDIVLGEVGSNYWLLTHNYVPRVTKYIVGVKQNDNGNNNMWWMYAIQINMDNIMIALK